MDSPAATAPPPRSPEVRPTGPSTSPSPVGGAISDQLELVLGRLPDVAVLVVDRDLRYIGVGGPGVDGVGWAPEELLGRTIHDVVPPDEAAVLAAHYRRALAGEHVAFERRRLRAPDRIQHVDLVPIRDADDDVEALMVIVQDITDRTAELQLLAASQLRIHQLHESSPDMLALRDLDGTFLEVSPASQRLFGWPPAALVGMHALELVHPDDLERVIAHDEQLRARREPEPLTHRLRCRDGSYRWVESVCRHLPDQGDEVGPRVQCTTRDVTRRHAAEEALRAANIELARSNADLDQLAAVVSHDLRSPLTTGSQLLELLAHRLGPHLAADPLADEVLTRARRQLGRLTETVDSLLQLARVRAAPLEPTTFTANELVADVLELIGAELSSADVWVEVTRDGPLRGDRAQLRLLLQNLLSNAARAAADCRAVRVGVEVDPLDAGWTLHVSDDGDGVADHLREQLLDPERIPVQPLDGEGRPVVGAGLGFGLVTCRRVAERDGGRLEVTHLDPRGTRFSVIVPGDAGG